MFLKFICLQSTGLPLLSKQMIPDDDSKHFPQEYTGLGSFEKSIVDKRVKDVKKLVWPDKFSDVKQGCIVSIFLLFFCLPKIFHSDQI